MIASTSTTHRTGSVERKRRSISVVLPCVEASDQAPARPPSVPHTSAMKIASAPETSTMP